MAPPDKLRLSRPRCGLSLSVLDLAQIRTLAESTTTIGGSSCPSCDMPFDKGKKRRLIDSCGHERCYSCLFHSEACPICLLSAGSVEVLRQDHHFYEPTVARFCSAEPASMLATNAECLHDASRINSLCGSPEPPRTRINLRRENAPRDVLHWRDSVENMTSSGSTGVMSEGLKTKSSALPASTISQARYKGQAITQSAPTPPNQRKRFFTNSRVLRSPFAVERASRRGLTTADPTNNDNASALSAWMTLSWERKSRWPGVVLGKIKSLWSTSQGSINDGLNQLGGSSGNKDCDAVMDNSENAKDGLNQPIEGTQVTDDEGGCVKPVSSKTWNSSQSDLYMRLGLLLDPGSLKENPDVNAVEFPKSPECVAPGSGVSQRPLIRFNEARSHDTSFSSLTSLETQRLASTNTSPVSTLTGTSSEVEVAAALRSSIKPKAKSKAKVKVRDCDSARNLASISNSVSPSTSMSMSMSVSVSGLSNGSSSPITARKYTPGNSSSQSDELDPVNNRRPSARRTAKGGNVKGTVDSKLRMVQPSAAQLTLKPLFFEVPLVESDPLFIGRQWILQLLENVITGSNPGVLLSGTPGTGKTALILQLVEHSCFGRRRFHCRTEETSDFVAPVGRSSSVPTIKENIRRTNEKIRRLASHIVAYHFCQADNNSTCLVPDLIHSLAAQLCQAPQLTSYREYLLSEPHLQGALSQRECTVDPDLALARGIIEPLLSLRKSGRLPEVNMVILIDAVCEAEYHRPDRGDTIASFLTRHAPDLPSWLKIVCTVRTQLRDCTKHLPYTRISLDTCINDTTASMVTRDLADYIAYKLVHTPAIQTNVSATINGKTECSSGANQTRFASHLLSLSCGSFLFSKLTLDLIESGHLVAKSASYKVLPVSLGQIFQLHFNLRFPTASSFDKVQPLLGVCLAALHPLTLNEIYYSVNSMYTDHYVSHEDFLQRFKTLSGFIVKRLDDTYMFFHPSFREWLMRRDEGESTKFLCDLRLGHAAIAFRLSRLQAPLDGDKVLELGHHVLKAYVYRGFAPNWPSRDLQAVWMGLSSECVSWALCTLRNIYSPNVKVSRLLLLAGSSPDHVTDCLGNAPVLCMYAHEGSVEMVSLLLEFGANVERTNSQGCTALSLAAARGHCDVVRRLAAAGARLGHADMAGQCSLVHAARHGKLSIVSYLLACNWSTTTTETHSSTSTILDVSREEAAQQAVVAAAAQGHEAVVQYLLDLAEVTVDQVDSLIGETAITIAAANGSTATVSALLARGANPMATNSKGLSALMLAAREGHWGTASSLLQGSLPSSTDTSFDDTAALLEQRDPAGRTAIMLAAAEGHTNIIELFLDKGSILETKDNDGLGALSWACVRGRINAVQSILDWGADVNVNDNTGRTPLDLAAFQGNPKLVQLLLERGAAIEHVDLHGMRPLDRAIGCRNVPVVQCFLRRGAKLGPATWAMAAGKSDVLLVLLNKLLEDGNVLYRKGRLKEASHRYAYALKKFPDPSTQMHERQRIDQNNMIIHMHTFTQLRLNFLLNLSRCKRKMNECDEAIGLADEALKARSDSYEALYARAKARFRINLVEEALSDVQEALQIAPVSNRQDRRVLFALSEEILSRLEGTAPECRKTPADGSTSMRFRASIDTLTEL